MVALGSEEAIFSQRLGGFEQPGGPKMQLRAAVICHLALVERSPAGIGVLPSKDAAVTPRIAKMQGKNKKWHSHLQKNPKDRFFWGMI